MKQYLELCRHVLKHGKKRQDRTGIGTISVFGYQMRFNLGDGFPLVTTKKIHLRSVIHELLWFLRGETNIRYLHDNNVTIWDEWADENGDLGPIYGKQWRSWEGVNGKTYDQIQWIIDEIKRNSESRRLLVSAWNVADVHEEKMALPPCHVLFQFYVEDNKLSCQLYQRSGDVFLGVPFNIASYALLTHMIAHVTGLGVGEFIHTFGDVHIYQNHIEQVRLQLTRTPYPLPSVRLNSGVKNINDFTFNDIEVIDYQYHPSIKGEVAV